MRVYIFLNLGTRNLLLSLKVMDTSVYHPKVRGSSTVMMDEYVVCSCLLGVCINLYSNIAVLFQFANVDRIPWTEFDVD